jgi:nuclear-control-of-ATPase protein 2
MQVVDKVTALLEEMSEQILSNLHDVQKSLCFWQSRAEADSRKVHFMVFERGPLAFIEGTIQLVRGLITQGSPMQHLAIAAASQISERVAVLTTLQRHLATLLAEIHKEIDSFGEEVVKEFNRKAMSSMLVAIHKAMIELENTYYLPQSDYSLNDRTQNDSVIFQFDALPEELQHKSEWTDDEMQLVVALISSNLRTLNQCLSQIVSKYRSPRRAERLWLRYAGTAVGLAVCLAWLLRHSRLMGSTDLDDWIRKGKDSIIAFWKEHVELPLLSIRNELFETFRRRHKSVVQLEEVQLTANSLHRMLRDFSELTTGRKLPEGASEQEMMEIMMGRYEKEVIHPLQNLLGGELARALLIQIQKLKLDIETVMLGLDQILKANEINFAMLAALPALFITVILAFIVRLWLMKNKGAEDSGRDAGLQRRLLLVEAERKIMEYQVLLDQEMQEKNVFWTFGMILYKLDRLYKATERHARATGEWQSLRADILDLANPRLAMHYKLAITARMARAYECLLPLSRRLL